MKRLLPSIIIFFVLFIIYFVVGTNYTLKPKWTLDYHNLLSQSLINFQLDIPNPPTTYDLAYFGGKWYTTWGIIPALILIPLQYIRGQFVPTFYLSILFSSMNVVLMYFLLNKSFCEKCPFLRYVFFFSFLHLERHNFTSEHLEVFGTLIR